MTIRKPLIWAFLLVLGPLLTWCRFAHGQADMESGLCLTYGSDPARPLRMLETYRRMQRDGYTFKYDNNGDIRTQFVFRHGQLNGFVKKYDPKGRLLVQLPYLEGRISGLVRRYHPNGRIEAEISYEDDLPHGEARFYSADGSLRQTAVFVWGLVTKVETHGTEGL